MGKLFNTMIMGVMITVVLLVFNGGGQNPTSLFLMMMNPSNYENSSFYLIFGLSGLATLTGGILIGVAAIIRQDWLLRAGIISLLNTIVIAPFVDLFKVIHSQTNFIGVGHTCMTSPLCSYIETGGVGQLIALVIVGPMIIYALWASIEYIWKGDGF
jgi:hypothetical protein